MITLFRKKLSKVSLASLVVVLILLAPLTIVSAAERTTLVSEQNLKFTIPVTQTICGPTDTTLEFTVHERSVFVWDNGHHIEFSNISVKILDDHGTIVGRKHHVDQDVVGIGGLPQILPHTTMVTCKGTGLKMMLHYGETVGIDGELKHIHQIEK